jgi:hypothetical protein
VATLARRKSTDRGGEKMTDKAKKILQKMNNRQALIRLANPRARNRILDQFNRENLDDVGPLAGDKGDKFLTELNEMADLEGEAGLRGLG